MADQEFQGKGTGVGGDGGAATAVAPSADTSTAGDDAQGQPIDLTSLPEFRSWQSKQDQKLSALQQRLAQAEAAKEREALAGMDQYERAQYEAETLRRWCRVFVQRFFWSQFKRSCTADGPKVGTVALSPRGDWRMPSDARVASWVAEVDGWVPIG